MTSLNRSNDFPDIQTAPDSFWCLHLPAGHQQKKALLEQHLAELAAARAQTIVIARPQPDGSILSIFRKQTSVSWLMNRGMVREDAIALIDSLGVHVHEILACNAGDPRGLLSIAAAFHAQTDIVVYATAGLSPAGRQAVCEYVDDYRADRCVVHLAPSVNPVRSTMHNQFCPMSATCIELSMPAT